MNALTQPSLVSNTPYKLALGVSETKDGAYCTNPYVDIIAEQLADIIAEQEQHCARLWDAIARAQARSVYSKAFCEVDLITFGVHFA